MQAALVTAIASLVVAVLSAVSTAVNTRRTLRLQRQLEIDKLELVHRLESARAVADARRDYEYEARKRLYEQCEPVLFQATLQAEAFTGRVASIARSARESAVRPDGTGWLGREGYYFTSTVYLLLAPLATARILQRRLTSIDLGLEPRLRIEYELIQTMYRGFTQDFVLASAGPTLPYEPDRADPEEDARDTLLAENPRRYRRQGLYFGSVELLADALLTDDRSRCRSYGEFLEAWRDDASPLSAHLPVVREIFHGFHPDTHPVLWRVLVVQYFHHLLFLQLVYSSDWHRTGMIRFDEPYPGPVPAHLDWCPPSSDMPASAAADPVRIARLHVESMAERLRALFAATTSGLGDVRAHDPTR